MDMTLFAANMLLKSIFLFSVALNIVDSSQYWTLFKKLNVTNWKSLSSPQYVFQHDNVPVNECIFHCMDQPNCQAICLYQNTCFGNSDLMPDASKRLDVQVYVKQPINVCSNDHFLYYNDLCLHICEAAMEWPDARTYCKGLGGKLIVLESEKKHTDVVNFLNTYYEFTSLNFFVGATDEDQEGSWTWVDGNATNYFNFQPGQPNNKDVDYGNGKFPANCGAFRVYNGLLIDEYCLQNKPFICEIKK